MPVVDDLDGVTVHAYALGYDGSQTDGTEWSLERSDLPRLTVQIGSLTVNRVDALDYVQYVVNGVVVDPSTITPVDFGDSVVIATGNHEGSVKAWITIKANMIAAGWHEGKMSTTDALNAIAEIGHPDPEAILAGYPAHAIKAAKAKASKDAAKAKKAGLTPAAPAEPPTIPVPAPDPAAEAAAVAKAAHQAQAAAAAKAADEAQATAAAKAQAAVDAAAKALEGQGYSTINAAAKAASDAKQAADWAAETDAHQIKVTKVSTSTLMDNISAGSPPNAATIEYATDDAIKAYLNSNLSKPADMAGLDVNQRRQLAATTAAAHQANAMLLVGLGVKGFKGAVDTKRAVARETGNRRPTGGSSDPATHVVYGHDTIAGLPRDKLEAILNHHSGGTETKASLAKLTDVQLRAQAMYADDAYSANVHQLQSQGYQPSQIPHSQTSTSMLLQGKAQPLIGQGPAGSPKPASSPHHPTGSTPSKPPLWDQMSQSSKASWASKHGGTFGTSGFVPHPAEWQSWTPAKKAGWTKKAQKGMTGAVTNYDQAGLPKGATVTTAAGLINSLGQNRRLPAGTHTVVVATGNTVHRQLNDANAPQHGSEILRTQQQAARHSLTPEQRAAADWYSGSGYTPMNACVKNPNDCGYGYGTNSTAQQVKQLASAFKNASPAPTVLIRGKHQSKGLALPKELNYKVGEVHAHPGFGSWSTSTETAGNSMFGNKDHGNTSVMTRIINSHGVPGLRGNVGESETILPPNVRYKIVAIHDVVGNRSSSTGYGSQGAALHLRTMDVEVVGWDDPATGKPVYIDADGTITTTKPKGATFVARRTTLTVEEATMTTTSETTARRFRRAGQFTVDPTPPADDGVDDAPSSVVGEHRIGETEAEFRARNGLDDGGRYGDEWNKISDGPEPDSIVFLSDDDPDGDPDFDV